VSEPSSREDSGPLIIEFIGATGAGKSTLVAALIDTLAGQGVRAREANDAVLAWHGLGFVPGRHLRAALVYFFALLSFARSLCGREGRRLSWLAVRLILRDAGGLRIGAGLLRNLVKRVGTDRLLRKMRPALSDCDVVVCDEGLVHAAHNLFVHAGSLPRKDEIVLFGSLVPRPDLLVWVIVPTARSAEVIRQRGHPRVTDPATAQAFAERAHETFEVLSAVPGLRERIYRLDNRAGCGPTGPAVRPLAALLVERLRPHGPQPDPEPAPPPVAPEQLPTSVTSAP
jgi:thymidylate kinase